MEPAQALVATHSKPVWRDQSNFIIRANFRGENEGRSEQLFARQLDPRTFELCCIPFFVYDLALGDIVETDAGYVIERVIQKSGRYVFRVWFHGVEPNGGLVEALSALGSCYEWSSPHLLAIDAADSERAQAVADFLQDREREGRLVYETGATA
jgi:hypothetical protein